MVGAGVTYSSDLDEDSGRGSAGTVSPTTSGGGMPLRERSGSIGE